MKPGIEFKAYDLVITHEKLAADEHFVSGFLDHVMTYACAACNARCNFTLYFGVTDSGIVRGVGVEDFSVVSKNE